MRPRRGRPAASPRHPARRRMPIPKPWSTIWRSVQRREKMRRIEALLFAASEPLDAKSLMRALEDGDDVEALLAQLQQEYHDRGVSLVKVAGKWQFRTADDLSFLLERQQKEERKLSRAALETLAIIAYHQPVTRAEIEEIRGVSTSPGTLDVLMETAWIRPRGRRRAPGRPLTFGTTEAVPVALRVGRDPRSAGAF